MSTDGIAANGNQEETQLQEPPQHVAECDCSWAVSTRGENINRRSVEAVAEVHAQRCGPIELRKIDEPPREGSLAEADGEVIDIYGGDA